jgi:hypothetical protein
MMPVFTIKQQYREVEFTITSKDALIGIFNLNILTLLSHILNVMTLCPLSMTKRIRPAPKLFAPKDNTSIRLIIAAANAGWIV